MEEALWHLEDQWKLSTHKAIAIFSSTCVLMIIIGLCLLLVLKRRGSKCKASIHQEPTVGRRSSVGMARWSEASKWDRDALLVKRDGEEVGWGSHSSSSAVWQKPILMGEKCELPRFSGLILYDQRGLPLDPCYGGVLHVQESMSLPIVKTTLKDLL